MLNLRTDFPFKACGLDGLSEADKDAFITDVFAELELRVGRRLSEGLSDAALDEFERLVDGDEEYCRNWLRQHEPEYQDQPEFIRLATSGHPSPHHEVARLIWLVRSMRCVSSDS